MIQIGGEFSAQPQHQADDPESGKHPESDPVQCPAPFAKGRT